MGKFKAMPEFPRISFCMIVLNGEPFTKYCLRAVYPYAHEIIVAEGAVEAASAFATHDGHSIDGTVESLVQFKSEEDCQEKLHIVKRHGFWTEKDEQSRVCFEMATGDYVWQVDVDEFYLPTDIEKMIALLKRNPMITQVSFKQITFWGSLNYYVDSWYLRDGAQRYHRLFKWGKGFAYVRHRPPTVVDQEGRDLRGLHWLTEKHPVISGIRLYHYSLLFPKNVREKSHYYSNAKWAAHSRMAQRWAKNVFDRIENPFRVHNVYTCPSWLNRYMGQHPPVIQQMISDIRQGKVLVDLRRTDDIDTLLKSRTYRVGTILLKILGYLYCSRLPVARRSSRRLLSIWNRAVGYGLGN